MRRPRTGTQPHRDDAGVARVVVAIAASPLVLAPGRLRRFKLRPTTWPAKTGTTLPPIAV
jgi:hypothetical protein